MALPSPEFYSTGDIEQTTHDFEDCEAGAYAPDSTGWKVRLWNDKDGTLGSETMTSVKISVRDIDGGTDELWTQQHWIQIKSSSGSTGVVDDAMTEFQAVGKNKELSLGDIPSNQYRTLYVRCYPPTDAIEGDVDFQLKTTYQDPQTSICKWITGLRGNGVVASTGDPFAMSTGGSTGTIPYDAGYALIYNNEIYYGSSGSYDITTTGSGTYKIYLNESGAFGETTGSMAANQLELYEATISSGVCTAVTDKRVYIAGLQSGTTGAMPSTPDLGDMYLDITNGKLYAAKTAGNWTVIVPGATFVALTDTPANYTGDANKFLSVSTGEDAVEFVTPTADEIEVSEIVTATYDDVQDWLDNVQSGGIISGGTIADDSSGGITISSGTGIIKSTTGDIGLTKSFDWPAGAIVSTGLTDESANYIYMDYNATGSPQILATADRTEIRLQDQFTMGRIYKSSGDLHILNTGVKIYNFSRREHERLVAVRNFERASGGDITESATTERALDSTIGNFYLGLNRVTTTAKDTSTGGSDYFTSWYYINSAWTSSTGQQQIDNTQYNNPASTGLETLTAGRYGVHWTYIHFDGDIQTVYGQGDYTLTQAENAAIPDSLPSAVDDFSTLAAKIILQKNSTGFTSVVTAYKVLFPVSSPAEHNDLGALDTADYQHLTQAEHDEITQWADAVTLSTGGAINLVTFSTGGTVNIPSGEEYQINGAEVKLDEWATPTTGTTLNATTGLHGLLPKGDADTTHYLAGDISWVSTTGIVLDSLATPTTGTVLNATTGRHGLLPILPGVATQFLDGSGTWATINSDDLSDVASIAMLDEVETVTSEWDFADCLNVSLAADNPPSGPYVDIRRSRDGDPTSDVSSGDRLGSINFTGYHTAYYNVGARISATVDGTCAIDDMPGRLEFSTTPDGSDTPVVRMTIDSAGNIEMGSTGGVFDFGAHAAGFTEQAISTTTGTAAINWNLGNKALFTRSTGAAGAATFSFTAPVKSANLMLVIRGSTAGSTGTITWPAVKWDGGSAPTLGSGASDINVASFYYSTGLASYLGASSTGTFSS